MTRPVSTFSDVDDFVLPSHGGDLVSASRLSGIPAHEIKDFSVNVNPLGLPGCVAPLLEKIVNDLGKYPDTESPVLKQTLAESFGMNQDQITVTNGSTEFIYMLPSLWEKHKSVLCVSPCFSEYQRSFRLAGINVHEYALRPENDFKVKMHEFLEKIRSIKDLGGIILGHPNNPTAGLWEHEPLLELLNFCETRGIYLVVDETFIEFSGLEHSLAAQSKRSKILILVQSLTKFYSLAGLRIGHGICSKGLTDRIREMRPPWSVNAPAQIIGNAVLQDLEYRKRTRDFIQAESQHLYNRLKTIKGIKAYPSHANFILFQLLNADSKHPSELYLNMLHEGILIRNCSNFSGLNANFFRVAVKNRNDNEFLLNKLEKHLNCLNT